jgi:gamma-glutamyltranspeptidase/glutathione hydrolase
MTGSTHMNIASSDNFISRRSPVLSTSGIVASSQPFATLAGVKTLEKGGSAADAAIAVAAALNVTQPCSTGLGGDCFCLYYEASQKRVLALNGSGRAPAALDLERIFKDGLRNGLPDHHPHTVTVPGAPAAWCDVQQAFGRLQLAEVLEPAILLAERGFPVAPLSSQWWSDSAKRVLTRHRFGEEIMFDGRGPLPGEVVRIPTLARSLKILAEEGKKPFYDGRIAERIVEAVREEGGVMTMEDLASHASEWIEPISIDYRGVRIWECPPNGHGLAALLALTIARCFDVKALAANSAERYHLLIECMRLAFADTSWYVTDPDFYAVPTAELLSEKYAKERAGLIDLNATNSSPPRGNPKGISPGTDTVYFSAVDGEGNGCSFINSTFLGFGSGIVPEGCGYSLQNRGLCFSLDPEHPNRLEPKKRPYHTIIPGLATHTDGGTLFAVFGVMGGMMQPQGHLQVVSALVDDELDPQAALDRARFQLKDGLASESVLLEDSVNSTIAQGLTERGQRVEIVSGRERSLFGLGQIIIQDSQGVFWAGSDPRGDGCAMSVI